MPIALEGMVVNPGDLVIGDRDGVLAVPMEAAESVLAKTLSKQDAEMRQMAAIENGTNDRSWVDESLKRLGCSMP